MPTIVFDICHTRGAEYLKLGGRAATSTHFFVL